MNVALLLLHITNFLKAKKAFKKENIYIHSHVGTCKKEASKQTQWKSYIIVVELNWRQMKKIPNKSNHSYNN